MFVGGSGGSRYAYAEGGQGGDEAAVAREGSRLPVQRLLALHERVAPLERKVAGKG